MATTETAMLRFPIGSDLNEALHTVARHKLRSVANTVEMLICDFCNAAGIAISPPRHHQQ